MNLLQLRKCLCSAAKPSELNPAKPMQEPQMLSEGPADVADCLHICMQKLLPGKTTQS
jgi:hypothetical protein